MPAALLFMLMMFAGISNASDELNQMSPCPGLVSSYELEQFEQVLVVTDLDFASVEDCDQLGRFFFTPATNQGYALDYSRLTSIVDDIWQADNEEASLLLVDAVLSWMQGLGLDEHAEAVRDFFVAYMPSKDSVRLFFSIAIWLIVIAVLILVMREFYRAGLISFVRNRSDRQSNRPETGPALQWDRIQALPVREQIGALLQYSIERLSASKLIPESSSFTNYELIARLNEANAEKARLLLEQIEFTEPVVYGDEPVTDRVVNACRALARELGDA